MYFTPVFCEVSQKVLHSPPKIHRVTIDYPNKFLYNFCNIKNAEIIVSVQCRNMRNRIFRKKEYSLLAQVPISVADFNALAVRNYEGTE